MRNQKVGKKELCKRIAEETGLSQKDAEAFYDSFAEQVMKAVGNGEKVRMLGFATFEEKYREGRYYPNPQTGGRVKASSKYVPVIRPGSTFKKRITDTPFQILGGLESTKRGNRR